MIEVIELRFRPSYTVCILKLGARHTIFCVQELLVCWEITLYFAFIWAGVPEKPDTVKGVIYSTVEPSE